MNLVDNADSDRNRVGIHPVRILENEEGGFLAGQILHEILQEIFFWQKKKKSGQSGERDENERGDRGRREGDEAVRQILH
jgi:hypothetical protein